MSLVRFLLCALLFPAWLTAAESLPVKKGAVEVQLVTVASGIQPGATFTVALRLQHDAHWHSYWIAPGTGFPTSLAWILPPGFVAGEIQWPTPHQVKDTAGTITGNGYEGETYLLVDLTAPKDFVPGKPVNLEAAVEWLMCREVCMPGDAKLALTIPAANSPDARWTPVIAEARTKLPQAAPSWNFTATRQQNKVTLTVQPRAGTTHRPADLHFFASDALIDYLKPQPARATGNGWTLELEIDAATENQPPRLTGVLASSNGWGTVPGYGGAIVDVPFTAASAGVAVSVVSPPSAPVQAASPLLGTLAVAFIGGLVLNLMPCVFPVLGIKILGFVNQSGNDRRKITAHGLTFAAGVLVSFWALAGALLVLRAGGAQLGWGFQLQSAPFVFGMAVFLLIFGLNLSGLFEIGLAATGVGGQLQSKEGFTGSFFTGALATLVATPCSAPFLAPALGAALSLSAVESFLVFTAIALGLALPYLLLSLFPQAIKFLPRPGAWMETFKQFMAFPLYATVGWLLWVLAAQTKDDDNALLLITFGFVLIAMASWIYGRFGQAWGKPARQRFGRIAAALLLGTGLYVGWPKTVEAAPTDGSYQVTWEKWSPAAIAAAQAAGKFAYVDFTARWCATCQTNKATVFHSAEVLAELKRKNVVLLRGDWTNRDPLITAELARWNRSAVPFNLIYAPGRPDPLILPELLTPGIVLDAFASATAKQP